MARRAQRPQPKPYVKNGVTRWRAWVNVGVKPNGRPHQVHVDRATWDECDDEIDRLWINRKKGITPSLGGTTRVGDWLDHYIEKILPLRTKRKSSVETRNTYKTWNRTRIKPYLNKHQLKNLQASDLEQWLITLRADGLKENTRRVYFELVRTALEVAHLRGYSERNVAKLVDAPAKDEPPIEVYTPEQRQAVFRVVQAHPHSARFKTSFVCGLRQGETLGLTWPCIDLHPGGDIRIEWQLVRRKFEHGCGDACGMSTAGRCPSRILPVGSDEIPVLGGLILKRPKSGSIRAVPMVEELRLDLIKHREWWDAQHKELGDVWASHGVPLAFVDDLGNPLNHPDDRREWNKIGEVAGVPHHGTHIMRHEAATKIHAQSGEGEDDLTTVQGILGHTSKKMAERYVHIAKTLKASESARKATQSSVRGLWTPEVHAEIHE